MPSLSRLLALLAAIMLVVAGAPAVAAPTGCDPCPPDCPMMQKLAAKQAAGQHEAPAKGGEADNPCQPMVMCQTGAAVAAPADGMTFVRLTAATVVHGTGDPLAVRSLPPDRRLRPPFQL